MIISAVTDPSIFGPDSIIDDLVKREALHLLEAIRVNGVLIVDTDRELLEEALRFATALSTKMGQRIVLALTDLCTSWRKCIVPTRMSVRSYNGPRERLLSELAITYKVDALITTSERLHNQYIASVKPSNVEVVPIRDYSESRCETTRKRVLSFDRPLDKTPPAEIEDRVGRVLKYCTRLRVFDGLLVSSESRLQKYCDGILYFINIWKHACVIEEERNLSIEVYSLGNRNTQNGFMSFQEARKRLETFILARVRTIYCGQINGHIKQDSDPPIFHARFLESRGRAYMIDPGFDAIGEQGPIRRCFLLPLPAGDKHLEDCCKLPDAK